MQDAIRVLAGECTITFDGNETREERGEVVTIVKPDNIRKLLVKIDEWILKLTSIK